MVPALVSNIIFLVLSFSQNNFASVIPVKCPQPPNFPEGIELERTYYQNWSEELCIPEIWEAYPKTAEDAVILANWAHQNKFNLRPTGARFSWAPITYYPDDHDINNKKCLLKRYSCKILPNVMLVATTHWTNMVLAGNTTNTSCIIVQTGTTLNSLTQYLEDNNYGLASITAIGDVTIGGALATGSHGTGISQRETNVNYTGTSGRIFGSLSSLIVRLEAIVWNETLGKYSLQSFERSDGRIAPLLTSLGRILVTQVTLRVGRDKRIRCLSITNVTSSEVFAPPHDDGSLPQNSFAHFLNKSQVAGILYFPFAKEALVRVWLKTSKKPNSSMETNKPYNYWFQENYAPIVAKSIGYFASGNSPLTVQFNQLASEFISGMLKKSRTDDLWGWSKNTFYYVKSSTVRISVSGFVILTKYSNIQKTLAQVYKIFNDLIMEYKKCSKFPINGPMEVRVTSISGGKDSKVDPLLSNGTISSFGTNSPCPSLNKEFDVAIWIDITTMSKTRYVVEFMFDIQSEFYRIFDGKNGHGLVKPDWSKRWGYSHPDSFIMPWSNETFIRELPQRYANWSGACEILSKLDPYQVFANPLFKSILK